MKLFTNVYFHNPCQDGLLSAWVYYKYCELNNIKTNFYPLTHDKHNLDGNIKNANILFLDIAPNDKQLEYIKQNNANYFIIDHHKTNLDKFKDNENAYFDLNYSGCGLAWLYFFGDQIPLFLQMVQDKDLWTWKIENSNYFCEGLQLYTYKGNTILESFKLIDNIYNDNNLITTLIEFGKLLVIKKDKTIFNIAKHGIKKIYYYRNNKVAIINCDHDIASDLGNYIVKNYDYDFVVCWRYTQIDESYWFSLRSNGKVNVADLAKENGGGGHPNAAGFCSKIHPSIFFSTI